MSIQALHDAHPAADHARAHPPPRAHPHGSAGHLPEAPGPAAPSSPLWWSAPQRLGFSAALAAGLWLVIVWAVQ